MNFQLTQEQEMLVEAVRSFVAKELLPHEEAVDRADAVSPELAAHIRGKAIAAGFYAFNMPEEVGGGGLDYLSQALIERELSKVSWALHVFVARPSKILMACKGEQVNDYLLPCMQGEKIDCFALTEPGLVRMPTPSKPVPCARAMTLSSMAASTSSAMPGTPISPLSSPLPTPTSTTVASAMQLPPCWSTAVRRA